MRLKLNDRYYHPDVGRHLSYRRVITYHGRVHLGNLNLLWICAKQVRA